ncbi:MAG: ferrous iron transport protein B [Elusimicrobiota bacterium]
MVKKIDMVVAIAGNPNSGKSSIFNALTGARQHVGNWPGVTITYKEGIAEYKGYTIKFIDMPGTYSLSPYTQEEAVTRNFLVNEKPDLIVDVVDSTNLNRNLAFAVQLMELDQPLIIALNMFDELKDLGIEINVQYLATLIGVPLVPTSAVKKQGINNLLDNVIAFIKSDYKRNKLFYETELEQEIELISAVLQKDGELSEKYSLRWLAIKLIEKDQPVYSILHNRVIWVEINHLINKSIERLKTHYEMEPEVIISQERYSFVHGAVLEAVKISEQTEPTKTEKIDAVLLNRILGIPLFLLFMWIVFHITFKLGSIPMEWMQSFFWFLQDILRNFLSAGIIRSVIVDGIIGGVGGVLVFLPNILILFMAISFMEQSGYMARAAFLVDRFMHMIGLHGRSFIPMIMGFGCSVPALMACRTLKNRNDQLATMLVIPFISCGAKLPIYVLLIGAFFSENISGTIMFCVYLFGVCAALITAKLLKKTMLSGESEPFVMELPPYRMPTFINIIMHMWEKAWLYIKKAGTIILLASIVVWFLSNFPISKKTSPERIGVEFSKLQDSYAGKMGKVIEPAIRPLGFDWRIGIALISGISAKEIIVSSLSTIYSSETEDYMQGGLKSVLQKDKHFTASAALSLIIFVLLYVPCLSATIVFYKESFSLAWTIFMVMYTTSAAYGASWLIYNLGKYFLH